MHRLAGSKESLFKDDFPISYTNLLVDTTISYKAWPSWKNIQVITKSKYTPKTRKWPPSCRQKESFAIKLCLLPKECRSYIPTRNDTNFLKNVWEYCWVLCGWLGSQNAKKKISGETIPSDVQKTHETSTINASTQLPFGVTSGKFMNFVVKHRGIEIDLGKSNIPWNSIHQGTFRTLQATRHLAYMRGFISNLSESCNLFSRKKLKKAWLVNGMSSAKMYWKKSNHIL